MSVHLPALPSSLDTTMAVLGMFAFVLASGGTHVAVDARASRAAKDVLTKAKRLMEECQACVELQKKAVEQIQNLEAPKTPLAAATTAEEISEMVATFGRAVAKITQAATLMEQALDAADKHGPVLERRKKGWRKAVGDIRPTLKQLRLDIEQIDFPKAEQTANEPLTTMLLIGIAEQGMGEWARSLPQDEESVVDLADAKPVLWDLNHG